MLSCNHLAEGTAHANFAAEPVGWPIIAKLWRVSAVASAIALSSSLGLGNGRGTLKCM